MAVIGHVRIPEAHGSLQRRTLADAPAIAIAHAQTGQPTVDAVVRNFEIIGEAAGRLPEEFKDAHSEIDWFRIRGFRNRIVHDYFGIDHSIVWQIKDNFLPELIETLSKYY